jgi:predicted enzyme related to lactoylglutathione lyase
MNLPFVWFDLRTKDADASRSFHEQLFGWDVGDVPIGGDKLMMIGGAQPWASIVDDGGNRVGWCPYVHVDDLDAATAKAEELGATVLQPPTLGPAGNYTPIREPGGAVLALFEARS